MGPAGPPRRDGILSEAVILLPARNEEEGIGEVIERIPTDEIGKLGFATRVVVVDGHSSDRTVEISESRGAEIIRQNGSIGKGNGVREAISEIYENHSEDSDLLIMLDADATYRPEDIPRFINELESCDVVWGTRIKGTMEKGAMSSVNKFGNRVLSFLASIVNRSKTTDLCTGFWGFRSQAIKGLALTADGFNLEADLFGSVSKSGLKSTEIPINYDSREGNSSLKWYVDGPRILLMIMKKRFAK